MILDDIVSQRKIQLEREKMVIPFDKICNMSEYGNQSCGCFNRALKKDGISIIAEVKRASPSKGIICHDFDPVKIAKEYENAGADAISVLTEEFYFKGSSRYLSEIRKNVSIPIIRKDFIFDIYQIYEAKAIGADAILLITGILDSYKLIEFQRIANSIGLDCLIETHNEEEIAMSLGSGGNIIGINNRNLANFDVSISTTGKLASLIPRNCTIVSESGITARGDVEFVQKNGADAVLVGEHLVSSSNILRDIHELRGLA